MEHSLRNWTCKSCGRANETVVPLDGRASCAFCRAKTRIQENRDYLSVLSSLRPELPPGDGQDRIPRW